MSLVNLLDFNQEDMKGFFTAQGEKAFHGAQLFKWIHQHGVIDFEQMTNLSKSLRAKLPSLTTIKLPEVVFSQASSDGTQKWLLRFEDGNCIETVYIPEDGRGTLCVSSQVGCIMNCRFCSTAKQGFSRNLSVAEIIGQVWIAARQLSEANGLHDRAITNIVMMGMGEPLLNYDAVIKAMNIMMDDLAYGLSKYRVTLSTSGVVPEMLRLAKDSPVALAVSLHAPNDALRDKLVPINRKYPLEMLMNACKEYFDSRGETKRQVTMEYVMLAGVNDHVRHAKELVTLLQGVPAKVNLIPFNTFPGTEYECSNDETIQRFRDILVRAGVNTITRKTRGEDIDAACGQLVGRVQDRSLRNKRYRESLEQQAI